MKLRQYAYFRVWSDTLDPEQLTELIGIRPDEIGVRGSRHSDTPQGPVPRSHSWKLRCDERNLDVGAQIDRLMVRLSPARQALHDLLARGDAHGGLSVVRWFGDQDGDEEVGVIVDSTGSVVREDISLFGWHMDREALDFLAYVGADLDIDEYDQDDEDDNESMT